MKQIIEHFRKVDPVLFAAIGDYNFPNSLRGTNLFFDLCEIIIQQQLSERVGDVIFHRFKKLFLHGKIDPAKLLKMPDEKIRKCGISKNKINYMQGAAREIMHGKLLLENMTDKNDDEVIELLTNIKGIGVWSAEMFLMFSLGRGDVFSYGDLGLRRAIQKLYKLKKEPTQKEAEKISNKWKPYRSFACRILWNSL